MYKLIWALAVEDTATAHSALIGFRNALVIDMRKEIRAALLKDAATVKRWLQPWSPETGDEQ